MKKCKTKWLPKLFRAFLITATVLLVSQSIIAQVSVTGQVKNKDGNPVPKATIAVKSKKLNTVTDLEGKFSIAATSGDLIMITSVGYESYEIRVGKESNLVIELTTMVSSLDDVVVVGYGTQKKKDLTGSLVNINTNETKKYSTSDISQLLQGRAAGVEVNSDGQPGAVPNVRIRGYSTFGNTQPFYVVDGVPGVTIRDFSPNDIESITILKDASASAIYGANSANGVIIITTKQGRKNTEMKVEYNGYYGWDKVWQIQDVTNREQYQMLSNEARTNAGLPLFPANNPADPRFVSNINTDWQKEGLKTGNRQNHNISMSGGGQNSTYNICLTTMTNRAPLRAMAHIQAMQAA
jgi:TonB-dependent SusC/RagA subfamily outer membrane receptor